MPSSEEDGTAAAAEQLGSMSLLDSVESKAPPDAEKEDETKPAKLFCSACGKESDTAKKCTACKCAWYCDKDCQKNHRREHKEECRRIKKVLDERGSKLDLGTELDVGPLGRMPPREECPICMRALPLHIKLQRYSDCCGQRLCAGCSFQHLVKAAQTQVPSTCAFCREPFSKSEEETLARRRSRCERKDPNALLMLALDYGHGYHGGLGLPKDQAKCVELLRESAALGCPAAQYELGTFYHTGLMGLERDHEEAMKHYEKAAEGGHVISQHGLGCIAGLKGDNVASFRHWRLSAAGGCTGSMETLIGMFEGGFLQHGDLAETMRAFYRSRAELMSKDRDAFIRHLKMTGKYKKLYDL